MSARRMGARVEAAGRLKARSRGMWVDGRGLLRMSVCGGKLVGGGERTWKGTGESCESRRPWGASRLESLVGGLSPSVAWLPFISCP